MKKKKKQRKMRIDRGRKKWQEGGEVLEEKNEDEMRIKEEKKEVV